MPTVTVVPADKLIIVGGEALVFDSPFAAPANLHALQWDGEQGHMEWTDDYNMTLDASLYDDEVAPYVRLWEAEKARLTAEAEAAEAELNSLSNVRSRALTSVDAATSAAILAGFDYETDPGTGTPEKLHFSYDSFDQQNFSDSAIAMQLGAATASDAIPTSTPWNAYRNYTPETGGELVVLQLTAASFLPLYAAALNYKATKMAEGSARKALVESADSVEAVQALLARWEL